MSIARIMQNAAAGSAGGAAAEPVQDTFSVDLWTGNYETQKITNGLAIGPSGTGGSIYVSGYEDRLIIPNNSAFTLGNDFTVECWIYRNNNEDGTIVGRWYAATNDQWIFHIWQNGKLAFGTGTGSYSNSTTTTIPVGEWVHIAVTQTNNLKRLYINGVNEADFSGVPAITGDGTIDLNIGANSSGSSSINAYISSLRIVKGTALYGSENFTPPTVPLANVTGTSLLVGHSPSPLTDYSPNGFTVQAASGATASSFGPNSYADGTGGMVWIKNRSNAYDHVLFDTDRGVENFIRTNTTDPEGRITGYNLTAFNDDGYSIGYGYDTNGPSETYVGWSWKKSPKFFDIVTWTGDGVNGRQIPHNLGAEVGFIIVKKYNDNRAWINYHRSLGGTYYMEINNNNVAFQASTVWNDTDATDTHFTVGTNDSVNTNGAKYVAYLFAHDPSNSIACGSYVGNGSSSGPSINIGWRPQWLLIKQATAAQFNEDWGVYDTTRGLSNFGSDAKLFPNTANGEDTGQDLVATNSTGFEITNSDGSVNYGGSTYIYVAIRAEGV